MENTLIDFLASSRPQDRILILFAGHAVDIDKEVTSFPSGAARTMPRPSFPCRGFTKN